MISRGQTRRDHNFVERLAEGLTAVPFSTTQMCKQSYLLMIIQLDVT
jgi:hypothetical protein